LDGVRSLAVSAVLLFHGGRLPGGGHGVDVFFALSGFLITTLLLEERRRHGRISLRYFWARRALRLFPALAIVMTVVAVYSTIEHAPLSHETLVGLPFVALYVGNWAAALWHQSLGLLFHTWSLSVEEQFYVVWPLVLILVLRRARRPLPTLLAVALGGSALALVERSLLHVTDIARTAGTDYRADQLLYGCAVAVLFEMLAPTGLARLQRLAAVLFPIAVLFLGAVALGLVVKSGGQREIDALRFALTGIGLASAVVIVHLVARPTGSAARLLSIRPATYVGRISYGVYLWHIPVFRIVERHVDASRPVLLLLKLALTFGLAGASYRLVEQPLLRLKARFRPASDPSPTASTAPAGP
jgi:peptidoglycan/LPS O-acetylase OafA/YrhL